MLLVFPFLRKCLSCWQLQLSVLFPGWRNVVIILSKLEVNISNMQYRRKLSKRKSPLWYSARYFPLTNSNTLYWQCRILYIAASICCLKTSQTYCRIFIERQEGELFILKYIFLKKKCCMQHLNWFQNSQSLVKDSLTSTVLLLVS